MTRQKPDINNWLHATHPPSMQPSWMAPHATDTPSQAWRGSAGPGDTGGIDLWTKPFGSVISGHQRHRGRDTDEIACLSHEDISGARLILAPPRSLIVQSRRPAFRTWPLPGSDRWTQNTPPEDFGLDLYNLLVSATACGQRGGQG
jgi:hypothetical protein